MRQTIKQSLKQLVMLLVVGQILLVGAVLRTNKDISEDINDWEEGKTGLIEMTLADTAETLEAESEIYQLTEDEMPEPEYSRPEAALAERSSCDDAKAAPALLKAEFKNEEAYRIVELKISERVKVFKRTKAGRLIRIRVMPALQPLAESLMASLKKEFESFSVYQTNKYTEMVIAAKGRVGTPYITSSEKAFSISIPYQSEQARFALQSGEKIAEGITFYRDRTRVGSKYADAFILRMEPFSSAVKLCPVLANEGIAQKERLSSMVKRYNAVAGINGAYFTPRGDPIGTLIINRHLVSSPVYKRSVFGVTNEETLVFGNPNFSGRLRSGKLSIVIDAVNQPERFGQLVVFTPEYARSTLTSGDCTEIVLVKGKVVGINSCDSLIPPDGVVVSAIGQKAEQLKALKLGQAVELDYSINRPWNTIKHAVCGGPRLVKDGKKDVNGAEEKFDSSIINGRHPRTAVAITFDGDLLMVVVDGRSKRSAGMKLSELADYLRKLGARHAINLDGGGSSSMIVKGKTVNTPSDGAERRISNGILITNRQ